MKQANQKHQQEDRELKQYSQQKDPTNRTDIAIIGLACRFPEAQDYREFAENLLKGVNSIKEIPPSRWDIQKYYSPDFNEPNKSISKWCGLIEGIDQFDNQFFNISPREANNMDPQQRLLLEETWHCIEDSGVPLSRLQQKNTSVYVGVMAVDYHQETAAPDVTTDSYACLGNYECILANRISYIFGLQGASISIDAACASSLVAIHEAKRTLLLKESDYALAGGVSLNFHPWKYISFSKSRMLSPDGQCKTFDIAANGYVPGEGVGVILLQRLEDAMADGNHIYGIIKGSAVKHGGRTLSITAPRVESQKAVIMCAYKDAGVTPDTVTYVEAHGTGTSLGDPIEIESLTKAFRDYTPDVQFCKIGSVKTNIGHLEAAAGIAGVIKVLMMMHHHRIPQSLNIKRLNPIIDFKNSPFTVASEVSDWHAREPGLPLRAGVSSFGFGGVNSHIILEEYIEPPAREREPEVNHLFLLSAKSSNSIQNLLDAWKQFVHSEPFSHYSLMDLCTTLKLGRGSFPYRFGAHVRSKEELKELVTRAESPIPKQIPKHWCLRMGDFSFESLEQFRVYLDRFELFRQNLEHMVERCSLSPEKKGELKNFDHEPWNESVKPLYSFIVAYAGICTLIDLGFKPEVITGEKSGALVGLVLSGIMRLEDALAVLSHQKALEEVEFTRPHIPYYDSIHRVTVMPFHFDENYLRLLVYELDRQNKLLGQILVDGIFYAQKRDVRPSHDHQEQTLLGQILLQKGAITADQLEHALRRQEKTKDLLGTLLVRERYCTPDELAESLHQQDIARYFVQDALRHYVDKARLLNEGQFTFKRFLEEWNTVLKRSGRDLLQLLYDDQLLTEKGGRLRNEKLLLMIIIISCLRRLNQKWNLAEQQLVEEKRFYELVDLVTDEIMPKDDLIELLLSDHPDYASIAHTLNKRQVNRNLNNSYRYIKNLNSNIREIEDVSSWLIKAMEIKNVLPEDGLAYLPIDNIAFFEIGTFSEPVPFESAVHLKTGRNICELFTDSLLQLWLNGVDIQWGKIYREGSYKKAVLPVYPFDRKPFWLPRQGQQGSTIAEKEVNQKSFHYRRSISPQDPIIQDHIITEKPLMPGASLIELGLEAVQSMLKRDVHSLGKIIIQNPGLVEKELSLEVEVAPAAKRFMVKREATILCSGEFDMVKGETLPPLDLPQYMKDQVTHIADLYQALSRAGYNYGPGLQVIGNIWEHSHGYLFQLKKLPREEGQVTSLNPRLLDGVFQSALAAEYLGGRFPQDNTLYVPYFIKSFIFSANTSNPRFIYLDKQDIQKQGKDLNVQFRAYDAEGKGVYRIQGLLFKRVSNQFLISQTNIKEPFYLYKPVWVQQPLQDHPDNQARQHTAILFTNEDDLSNQLVQQLDSRYGRVFSISRGTTLLRGNNNHFKINPGREQDYQDVLKNIDGQISDKAERYDIYYLWSYDPHPAPILDQQVLREQQEKGVRSLFFLAKALTRSSQKNNTRIMVSTCNTYVVEPQDTGEGFIFGGFLGLAKTVMMENPRIRMRIIDFGTHYLSSPAKIQVLLNEGNSSGPDEPVTYRQGGRYVRTLEPCHMAEHQQEPVLRDRGVYFLIGGAGGLGLKVAEMIAKKVRARLILVGRSALSSEKRRCLEQLQTYQSEVLYIQGDVTKQEHMKKLMGIIKARYGALNGVIQTGGVLEDRFFINKDWESFHRVMAPKVYGTWIIHELTRKEPLDFFVVFSSIVSLLGNIGQVDYAAANGFLDAFIHYRAQNNYPGESIGINWTLWADGGMGAHDRIKINFEKRGLPPISSYIGLKALEHIIQYGQSCQLAVLGQKIQGNQSL